MKTTSFHFAIDLAAELRNITKKQHLNDVHYLVQLVRHALAHDPRTIWIRSNRHRLVLKQDGDCLAEEEWYLLTQLLSGKETSPEIQQDAVSRLEEKYGIAVLSLILNSDRFEISSSHRRLTAGNGVVRLADKNPLIQGYTLTLEQRGRNPRGEARELAFFCVGADVPIIFNNRKINSSIPFPNQIITEHFSYPDGVGAAGIPRTGDLCSYNFYKKGVRFGVKQFLPRDGLIVHGYWNSNYPGYEKHYKQSIQAGERRHKTHAHGPYKTIVALFPRLNSNQKLRIKKILMSLDRSDWVDRWGGITLFHSCREEFALSLTDLLTLLDRFEAIPFCPQSSGDAPCFIPCLLPEDVYFIRNELKLPLKLLQMRQRTGGIVAWWRLLLKARKRKPRKPLEESSLNSARKNFLTAMNLTGGGYHFYLTKEKSSIHDDRHGRMTIYLRHDHPELDRIMTEFEKRPELLPFLKYQLIALAM